MPMHITLDQILELVGRLDDSPGDDSPRERFRKFLRENVSETGQVRDYVERCLRNSGEQYNRALQDLVNHLGHVLGFAVTYGRYQGVHGQIGYDGYWESATEDFYIVVEVKTTDAYTIRLPTVVGYVDRLIEEKTIPSWDEALGLFVIGRLDAEMRQLEDAIIAQKRTHQFCIISVQSLLSLAEMMGQYDISHDDILSVIRPSGPRVDSVIDLMARLVVEPKADEPAQPKPVTSEPTTSTPKPKRTGSEPAIEASFWLTPVRSDDAQSAGEVIETLVGQERIYAFAERTPGRRHIKPGDWICFYATGKGVIAHAQVSTLPQNKVHPAVRQSEKYAWTFGLKDPNLYLHDPVIIDAGLRSRLDAFAGRDPNTSYWAWLVQATRKVTEHDFSILTRQGKA